MGQAGPGLARLTEAEAAAARLNARSPRDIAFGFLLARTRQDLADHFRSLGDARRAQAWAAAARAPWRSLDPAIPYVARMVATGARLPT